MIKISNSIFISVATKLLVLLVVAKSVSLGILWYAPSDGVELNVKNNYQPVYQRVNFSSMISFQKNNIKKQVINKNADIKMTNMLLIGLYGTKTKGFIIVAMANTPNETSVVGVGEDYKGYMLKTILPKSVVFEKSSQNYILKLHLADQEYVKNIEKYVKKVKKVNDYEPIGVSRNDIIKFSKNPKEIWQNISIKEVKRGTKIEGFKVTSINPNSTFAALGLKKGDIIIKANNTELKSYKDAIDVYSKIDQVSDMRIVVKRDNKEVELVYEIN